MDPANPYQTPQESAYGEDFPAGLADLEPLGFWPRVAATLVDNVIMMVAVVPLGVVAAFTIRNPSALAISSNVLSWIVGVAFILVFWNLKSATPGKMIFNARIVDAKTGGKPTGRQFLGRYLAYIPSTLALGLGFLWVIWDKRRRGWHDIMAGTLVVKPRSGLRIRRAAL